MSDNHEFCLAVEFMTGLRCFMKRFFARSDIGCQIAKDEQNVPGEQDGHITSPGNGLERPLYIRIKEATKPAWKGTRT